MKTVELAEATAPLAEYVRCVAKEPVILVANGKPVAALVAIEENVDLETLSLSTHPEFLALIERSRKRQRTEGGILSEEMRRRLSVNR
jgi:prevent-host-death family protein